MNDLVKYRLESAKDRLRSSRVLLDNGQFKDSIGRSYYAIFTAVRAILAIDKVDFAKHSGVIAYFQREYVKTGLIDMKYSRYLQKAFQIRNSCDYDDFYLVTRQDAEEQYEHAQDMISAIQELIEARIQLS